MYLSGEIEKWGSGIKNVYNQCREDNVEIKLENRKTSFFVIVRRKSDNELIENTLKDVSLYQNYQEATKKPITNAQETHKKRTRK